MKKVFKIIFPAILLLGMIRAGVAQKTAVYDKPDAEFRYAQELFNKEKYGAAEQKFLNVIKMIGNNSSELTAQSEYYAAMCAIELFNKDAEFLAIEYIRNHPEHIRVNNTWMQLARYYFRNKKYSDALATFDKVDPTKLNDEERNEFNFKNGYSAFMNDSLGKAKKSFYEVMDKESKYAAGATYYFAHIAYADKNYETALKSFRKIKKDEVYGKFAPYYIVQIYYIQEKWDDLISVAPALLDSATSKRAPEIARMIAEAYYKTERYGQAIPYFQIYAEKNPNGLTRDDYYETGYCYLRTANPADAIQWFSKVNTSADDSLTQITDYHLADAYLQKGEKNSALNYFGMASKLDFDPEIKENALFNYAKLSYETSYNPFNESIKSFQTYIQQYPNSPDIDEAYEYLSSIFFSTKNYKDALASLENVKKRDIKMNRIYQKVCYYRAVELFNDNEYNDAIDLFTKSLANPIDPGFTALAYYWRGESKYRQELWDDASIDYNQFLYSPGAAITEVYNLANYNVGYCYFKKKDYKSALASFKKFLKDKTIEEARILNDAYLRTGDCCFMTKDYTGAIENYDKSIEMNLADNDYAMYQKALSYGPLGKLENKASLFTELITKYPKSNYYDDALFEAGATYQNMNQEQKAIASYDKLIAQRPNSAYISRCYLKKGLIFYNQKQDNEALVALRYVVENYRGSQESRQALEVLRNVYVSLDRIPDFVELVKSLGGNITDTEQDSLAYDAVWKNKSSDCQSASKGFQEYLERFPTGIFAIDACYYKAECDYSLGNLAEALKGYVYIIGKPSTKYLETALLKASEITYEQKNYTDAFGYYQQLDNIAEAKGNIITARAGEMRCDYMLGKYENAINDAHRLLETDKLEEDLIQEAHLISGRSALATDSLSTALAEFTVLSRMANNEMGAEAKWNLGYIQYRLENYTEAQKYVDDLINQVPSYNYWVAKAFILWADIYVKQGNMHQAKYTLQSIIDNYEGVDLIKIAQDKLNAIVEAEKQEELKKQQDLEQQQQQQTHEESSGGLVPQDQPKPEQKPEQK